MLPVVFLLLTLKVPFTKIVSSVVSVDQDQAARFVQPDPDLHLPQS